MNSRTNRKSIKMPTETVTLQSRFANLMHFFLAASILLVTSLESILGYETSIFLLSGFSVAFVLALMVFKKRIDFPKQFTLVLALLLIWTCITVFFSRETGKSLWEVLKLFSLVGLLIGSYNLTKFFKGNLDWFWKTLLFGAVIVLFPSVVTYLQSGSHLLGLRIENAIYLHNQVAGWLILLIPVAVVFSVTEKNIWVKCIFILMVTFFLYTLFWTRSLGAALSLTVGLVCWFIIKFEKKIFLNIFLIGCALFVLVSGTYLISRPNEIPSKSAITARKFNYRDISNQVRLSAWKNSLLMITAYPKFGVGPGAFGQAYYHFQKEPWIWVSDSHNHLLQITAEEGLIGGGLFVSLLLFTFWHGFLNRNILRQKGNILILGIGISWITSFTHSNLDLDWSTLGILSLVWIYWGILLSSFPLNEWTLKIEGKNKLFYFVPLLFLIICGLLFLAEDQYLNALENWELGDFSNAADEINLALKINPYEGRYYYLSGLIDHSLKQYQLAINEYEKSFKYSKSNGQTYSRIGELLVILKRPTEAIKYYQRSINSMPYANPGNYLVLSQLYSYSGNVAEQKKLLETAVNKSFPLNGAYYGFEYLVTGSNDKPKLAQIYLSLANLELADGNRERAEKLTKVSQDLFPTASNSGSLQN